MATAEKKIGIGLHSDPATIMSIMVGLVVVVVLFQLVAWVKKRLSGFGEDVSRQLDIVAEDYGYDNSALFTDPYLAYNTARQQYATAHGYTAGTDNFRNPPGWPDFETWKANAGL